jgi:CheY-like chemotaxis protein
VATLAGGLAHDLNSLFTVILGSAQRLEEWAGYGSLADDAGRIVSSVQHAASLVAPLMALAGCDVLTATDVDCSDAMAAVIPLLEPVLDPGVRLVFHPSSEPLPVWIDRVQLQQAVLDLVLISARSLSGAGEVHLSVRSRQDRLDQVVGSDARATEVVIDSSAVPIPVSIGSLLPGMGPVSTSQMRLATSALREVVETAGGEFRADDPSSLQCVFPSLRPPDLPAGERAKRPESKPRTILVAEDGMELRELLVQVLSDAGFKVVAAGDGVAAEQLSDSLPELDVLLTDVVMPERGGYDLASKVAARAPGLVTIFMSGYIEDTGHDGWRPDPHWFLHKPFTIEQLLTTLDQAIRYREHRSTESSTPDHVSQ